MLKIFILKEILKFINEINEKKLKIIMKNFLSKKDFGLQQVHIKKKIFLFKNSFKIKKNYKDIITIIAPDI